MIIALFRTIFVEYTKQISLLSVTQFTIERMISSDSQQLTEVFFVLHLCFSSHLLFFFTNGLVDQ